MYEVLCTYMGYAAAQSPTASELPGAVSMDVEEMEHPREIYKPVKSPPRDFNARFAIP